MRVTFRVDASLEIGTGHVVRCLTLAENLRRNGSEVQFISRELTGNLFGLIEAHGYILHRLPKPSLEEKNNTGFPPHAAWLGVPWKEDARQTRALLGDADAPNWIVVDHYALDYRWEERLRADGVKMFVIDDLADRHHSCDALLDQNLRCNMKERYVGKVPDGCDLLLGPTYALLQSDYARLRPKCLRKEGAVRRVLVSFGGVDKDCLTEKVLFALAQLNIPTLEIDVVLSSSSPQFGRIVQFAVNKPDIRVHDRVPSLAGLMLTADLAIGAGGTTNWERMCFGLRGVVITVADNQKPTAKELASNGFILWLGDIADVNEMVLVRTLKRILSEKVDGSLSERLMATVDGQGVKRVTDMLLSSGTSPT